MAEANRRLSEPHAGGSGFLLLCLVGFLGRLGYEMVRTPITSLYAKHLGAPTPVIGLLVAAVTVTGIFVKSPAGALSDLFGFRRLMLSGLVVKATAPFLYLLVSSWPWLLVTRFYHGFSTALYAPAASAKVAEDFPSERGRRLGIYGAAENAGVVLGPVLGASLLAHHGFQAAFLASGVLGIAALLALLPLPHDAPVTKIRQTMHQVADALRTGLGQILSDRNIRLVSLMEGMVYTGVGTLQAYLPLYALSIHLSISRIGLLFGVQGITSILWRPLAGAAADRFGRKRFIVVGALLSAVVLFLVPHATTFGMLLILCALSGLATGTVTPATTSMIGDLVKGREFGAAMGVFGSLWDIGHAGGPLLAGILIGLFGYQLSFATMSLLIIGALCLFVVSFGKETQPTP